MLSIKEGLVTKVNKKNRTVEVNHGSDFYKIKLPETNPENNIETILDIAEIFTVSDLATDQGSVKGMLKALFVIRGTDPVYLQINRDNTKCAFSVGSQICAEVAIKKITRLKHIWGTIKN